MLKRNTSNLSVMPLRYFGALPAQYRSMWGRADRMNQSAGEGIPNKNASIPAAYVGPVAWVLPYKPGAMKATSEVGGTGTLSANALAVRLIEASISGSGELTAIGSLVVQLVAAITGSGGISTADLKAFLQAVASIGGSGSVTATLLGQAALAAGITGAGSVSSTATGRGNMTADLTVTGTGLTTANVGDAVWSTLIENGLTAEEIVRVLLAVAAGKTDISGTTVTFRDNADTKDRVTATMTGSERTTVSLNLS